MKHGRIRGWVKNHKKISIVLSILLAIGYYGAITTPDQPQPPGQAANSNGETLPIQTSSASAPTVLLDQSGSGTASTKAFTTGANWTVTYTFDCNAYDPPGAFMFFVNNTDGSVNTDVGADSVAATGGNTDNYYDSGEHYLQVDTVCDWHVVVKG